MSCQNIILFLKLHFLHIHQAGILTPISYFLHTQKKKIYVNDYWERYSQLESHF